MSVNLAQTESRPIITSNESSFQTNRIFISNLANQLEEFTIYKYCSAYGEITKCQIMKEAKSGETRGFGFITYVLASSAQALLNAQPHYIGHHKINVRAAFPTSEILVSSAMSTAAYQPNDPTSSQTTPTRRLFVAYNTSEASRNNLSEPAIFGYLSTFGVVKEIVQQFSQSAEKFKQNTANEYWIVEFLSEDSVNKCMAKGPLHFIQGVRVHTKRVITKQDVIRQKRQIQEQKQQEKATTTAAATVNLPAPQLQRMVIPTPFGGTHQPTTMSRQFFPPSVSIYSQRPPFPATPKSYSTYSSGGSLLPPPPPPPTTSHEQIIENPFRIKVNRDPNAGRNREHPSKRSNPLELLEGYGYTQKTGDDAPEVPVKRYKHLQF